MNLSTSILSHKYVGNDFEAKGTMYTLPNARHTIEHVLPKVLSTRIRLVMVTTVHPSHMSLLIHTVLHLLLLNFWVSQKLFFWRAIQVANAQVSIYVLDVSTSHGSSTATYSDWLVSGR